MRCLVYVLLLIFLFSSKVSYANKWFVNDASVVGDIYCTAIGSNANSGLTANLPFLTLSKAVSVALDDDTIYVDAGTYKNESIILKKNNLTIIGAGKYLSLFISNTILTAPLFEDVGTYSTCSSICNVIRFNLQHINIKGYKNAGAIVIKANNTVDTTRVFINSCFFEDNYTASPNSVGGGAICATTTGGLSKPSVVTIQNSDFYNNKTNNTLSGGSIFYKNGTRLIMESCNFQYCNSNTILEQPSSGGFIANYKGGPSRISNCVFRGAYLGYISSGSLSPLGQGGAIDNAQTDMVISSCYFHDNISKYGSAIYNFSGNLVIENSLFFDNTCGDGGLPGGTIHNNSGTTILNHCTIGNNKNTSSYSGGNSGVFCNTGSVSLKNSIVWGNSLKDVSTNVTIQNSIVDATGGGYTTGASTSDPLFSNSAGQDFRIAIGSPAIDLGSTSTLSSDLTGFTRISTPDAGAFESGSPGITIPACGTFIIPIADPVVGVTVEPTCIVPTGTAVVSSPAEGTGYEYSVDGGTYQVTATFSGLSPGSHTIQVRQIADITQKSALLTFTVAAVPSPPTAGITNNTGVTQLDCSNTSISLTANGGATYSWSDGVTTTPGASLLVNAAGTYTVTATAANGCTDTEVLVITKDISVPLAGITNNTGVTQIDCTNPSISLTATGGVSYSWSDGVTTTLGANLLVNDAGTYTVTATAANGCTDTEVLAITKDISVPTAGITNNTGVTQIDCINTAISLTATGGISYAWSDGTSTVSVLAGLSVSVAGAYTVTVTAANGCTDTETITVTKVASTPTAGITNNTGVTQIDCTNPSISLTATGGSTYSWSNGVTTTPGASLLVNAAGTYTVTATAANGCTDTEVLTITKDISVPTAAITNNTGVTQIDCTNPSISLTATGGATYAWSDGTSTVSAVAGLTISNAGIYTVTATAANGCTDTEVLTITKDISVPTAGITNNTGVTQIDCTNPSISLTATGAGTYAWSDGTSTVSILSGLSVSVAGNYTVTVTAANGCTDTQTIAVTKVASQPTAGITNNTGVTKIGCTNLNISLTATGGGTYAWSDGTSTVSVVAGLTVTDAGNYTVTVTAANGCTDTKTITITKDLTPPSDILFTNVTPKFCKSAGKQVSDLTLLASNLTQTITWYDAPVNGNSLNVTDLLVSGSYYAEQSEGACKSTNRTKVDVTVIDLAAPSIPGNNTQPSCLVATGSVELNMPSAGVWDITATPVVGSPMNVITTNITTNPFTYSFAGLATGSYTFQIKDENGCVSPTSTTVIIDQQPVSPATPILDVTEIYCASKSYTVDQIKFAPAPTGTVKYYDANDVAISGQTVVVANTVYKFSFDNGKCESKVKLSTTIPLDKGPTLIPLVDLTTSLICAIDKPTFNTIIANSLLTIPSGYTLLISSDVTGNPIVPNTTQIGSLGGATQTVYYNIVNDKGCQSTSFAKLQFKINEGPTDLVLTSTKTYCAMDKPTIASLNDAQISGTGVLKWYASETSITPLSGGATLTSGTYFASATLTPGCESVARKSVVVTVESFGQTTLDPANTYAFCKGSNKTIADLSTKPYFSNEIVWLNANKVVQSPGTVLIPGTYFAALTKNGCISSNTQEVDVTITSPIISITPSKLPTCGAGSGMLVITGADASYTYQWSKNGQVMTENGAQITNLIDDESVKYSVVVTDMKGCIAKDTAMFSGCEPGNIPQIITPDGNGKNDTWIIKYSNQFPEVTVLIFNRWGSLVYKSEKPYKDDWDGKSNEGISIGSDILPTGTYFYQIDKGNGDALESGYIELVR